MSDRRFGKRLELDAMIELVGAPGAASPPLLGRVVNLSGSGALATFRHGLRLGADGLAGRVTFGELSTAVAPLRPVRIEPAAGDAGAFGVGVRFADPTGRVLGDVAEILCAAQPAPVPLGSWDALVVAERDRLVPIRAESFPSIALRGRGRVFTLPGPNGNGGSERLLLRIASGGSGGRIEALPADQGRPPPASGASSVLVWTGLRSVILVRAVLRPGGWPAEVVVLDAFLLRRRSHDRVSLGPRGAASVRIRHPLLAGLRVSRRVRNVGEEGLCIETDVRADVLSPGLHLPEILVVLPDGAEVTLSGTVASIRTGPGGGALCGICIDGAPVPDAWDRFVLGRIAPHVRDIAPDDMDAVWDLFDRTGYLKEKDPELLWRRREPFASAWSRLPSASHLGRAIAVRDRTGLRGALSYSQVYPGTYQVHHLALDLPARDEGLSAASVAGQTYRYLYELCRRAPGLRYALGMFDPDKPWSKHLYYEFFALLADDRTNSAERMRLIEKRLAAPTNSDRGTLDGNGHDRDGVRPFAAADGKIIERAARRVISDLPRAALALDPLDPSLEDIDRQYRRVGLRRWRRVLVAERSGRPVGAAVVDCASPGISIFGLLDIVTLLPIDVAAGDWAWTAPLLAAVEEAKRADGAETVAVLAPAAWPVDCVPPEYEHVAMACRWVMHRSLVPAYLEYLDAHFGADHMDDTEAKEGDDR